MRGALLQLCSGDDPARNLPHTARLIRAAAAAGAQFVLTPECTNVISLSRATQEAVLAPEEDDATLAALRTLSDELRIWLLIGSLALKSDDRDGRFVNRAFLIGPDGSVRARYDKIHMFDVELEDGESYRESAAYRPGTRAVIARADDMPLGLTICYDLRFPHLYRALAQAGAEIIAIPSAFTVPTGRAHWHTLLRARAIETGAYILAPAQCGVHPASQGQSRRTYGHSLVVSPWGEVLADAGGEGTAIVPFALDRDRVRKARARIPALTHDRPFAAPETA